MQVSINGGIRVRSLAATLLALAAASALTGCAGVPDESAPRAHYTPVAPAAAVMYPGPVLINNTTVVNGGCVANVAPGGVASCAPQIAENNPAGSVTAQGVEAPAPRRGAGRPSKPAPHAARPIHGKQRAKPVHAGDCKQHSKGVPAVRCKT